MLPVINLIVAWHFKALIIIGLIICDAIKAAKGPLCKLTTVNINFHSDTIRYNSAIEMSVIACGAIATNSKLSFSTITNIH